MARGFAGGLAEGINNGIQMYQMKQYRDSLNDTREERNRILADKADAAAASKEGKGGFDEFDRIVTPIFAAKENAPAAKPLIPSQGGLSQGSMIPDAAFSDNAAAAYQAGGLAASAQPAQQAAPSQDDQMLPRQRIVKEMLFGNLANEPDRLNAINTAAVMSGVGKEVTPWLEGLYKAKKSGKADMAMSLISGDVDGAIDIANRMKTPFADRPVKVKPDDPNDQQWILQFDGGQPQKIDLKSMIGASMDPEKYLKWQNDTNESIGRRNVSDSAVRLNDSRVGVSGAQVGKLNAEARSAKNTGSLGGATKAPRVVKTVETNQGMVAVMSDGTQNLLKGSDGSPLFGTSGQKIAAGLVGKTLSPLEENPDIAGRVNSLTGQLQAGRQPQSQPSQENQKVRKFNPATGRFD